MNSRIRIKSTDSSQTTSITDPDDPKKWSKTRKWTTTVVVSLFALISPMTSSIMAPALTTIAREFRITNDVETQMTLSIFILGYAVGPLMLGPLSEEFGRIPVLQLSNLLFLAFNIGCGFSQSPSQLIVLRLFAGIGGSAPLSVGGGTLTDLCNPEERSKSVAVYSIFPVLGPALGPIAGGFIASYTSWRWSFWATSIADAVLQVAGFFFLRETFLPVIQARRAKKLRKKAGTDNEVDTISEGKEEPLIIKLRHALVRPMKMLATQPIVQALSLYMAYNYGLLYLILSTFARIWEEEYHEALHIVGLHYIALAIGFMVGAQLTAWTQPKIYNYLKRTRSEDGETGQPEFRTPLLLLGATVVPVACLIYAWTAETHTFWIGPDIGVALFGAGCVVSFQCISGYLIESYSAYAASALAAATFARSITGFSFALFAPYLYAAVGYGWGGTILAFVAIVIGFPAPLLLGRFGPKMRAKGTKELMER